MDKVTATQKVKLHVLVQRPCLELGSRGIVAELERSMIAARPSECNERQEEIRANAPYSPWI
jgi:hypothetical protein